MTVEANGLSVMYGTSTTDNRSASTPVFKYPLAPLDLSPSYLSNTRLLHFVAPNHTAQMLHSGLSELVNATRKLKKFPDQRLQWLRRQYVSLYQVNAFSLTLQLFLSWSICLLSIYIHLPHICSRRTAGTRGQRSLRLSSCLVGGGGVWARAEWTNPPARKTAPTKRLRRRRRFLSGSVLHMLLFWFLEWPLISIAILPVHPSVLINKSLFFHVDLHSINVVRWWRKHASNLLHCVSVCVCVQGDSGDATDDEMGSRKTRSCKEGIYRNGPESDSLDQDEPGRSWHQSQLNGGPAIPAASWLLFTGPTEDSFPGLFSLSSNKMAGLPSACSSSSSSSTSVAGSNQSRPQSSPTLSGAAKAQPGYNFFWTQSCSEHLEVLVFIPAEILTVDCCYVLLSAWSSRSWHGRGKGCFKGFQNLMISDSTMSFIEFVELFKSFRYTLFCLF